jgi:hypothetical protein
MVIFHSYVSLPEGIDQKRTNEVFLTKNDLRILPTKDFDILVDHSKTNPSLTFLVINHMVNPPFTLYITI